jgi:diguanylate cyclase (GGDEF)-like protein
MRTFKLTPYFSLLALLLMLIAGGLLGALVWQQEVTQMQQLAQDRNVNMTRVLGNFLQQDMAQLMSRSAGLQQADLQSLPEIPQLKDKIDPLIRGSDIVKVKIYNLAGITVFSTETAQIGESKSNNPGFNAARLGQVASELVRRNEFSAFEGERSEVDLLSSYVPVWQGQEVVAVFEQYQDVTQPTRHIERSLWQVAAIIFAVFGVLYVMLVVVVRYAQAALSAQQDQLEAANRSLDQRVAERTQALQVSESQLRQSEARFRSLSEMSSDFYWESDAQHRFTSRTQSAKEASDSVINQTSFVGLFRWEVAHVTPDEVGWQAHRAVLDAHLPFRDFEISRMGDEGTLLFVSASGDPVFDSLGAFVGYRGVGTDITARKQAEEKIAKLAFFDPLTHLPNRSLLMDRLQQATAANAATKAFAAVLILNLDNFKSLNDTRGHASGDQLLLQVAQRLLSSVQMNDTVARIGGDEFVVLLHRIDARVLSDAAARVATLGQKLLAYVKQPYTLTHSDFHCSASMGVVIAQGQELSVGDMLRRADMAMHQAKGLGVNRLVFFDAAMESSALDHAQLEADLRVALEDGQFELYYQPQVLGSTGQIGGAEALIRWIHPQRGLVPPADFIGHAERTGLILPLGQWVLETACQHLATWATRPEMAHLTVAVNVSAQQFKMPDFAEQVIVTLERTGANPQQLKLELTESIFAGNIDEITQLMNKLKALGVGFSLDDFGTGYSSLAYLSRLPLDQLKIDRSFVFHIASGGSNAVICAATISLAHSLKLKVVAEGVEDQVQRYFLSTVHRCDLLQGYLFSRPVPRESFESLVASWQV